MLNRRVVFNCCWRTWVEYGSATEGTSKGSVTKEEFGKWLESQASSRIRDSRDLEAFWSAFCATSGIVSDDGVECNLRFFRDGIQPSWEGSGAHGKFTYSTKKRFTKVKLFALIRTVVLEVLTHSVHVCGIVLSCRDQKDFISVWNTGSDAPVQQQMLDELMSVLDISPSSDCLHYLTFGDLLPGDMRQRIAGRTMHASFQRQQVHLKQAGPESTHELPLCCSDEFSAAALDDALAAQRAHADTCERRSSSPHASLAPNNELAASDTSDAVCLQSLQTSFGSRFVEDGGDAQSQVPWAIHPVLILAPLCAAAVWWLFSAS